MSQSLSRLFGAVALTSLATLSLASDYYVSPHGADNNPGTEAQPWRTLAGARDRVRVGGLLGKEPITVHLRAGTYYLEQTLVFTPADSGTSSNPVTYRAAANEQVVLSGGSRLALAWQPYRDGIWQARTPEGFSCDQLFVNGERQRMARYPNYDANQPTAAYQGFSSDAFAKERAARWKSPTGGYIHAMHKSRWGGYHYVITGKNADGEVTFEGGWQNNRRGEMHKDFRMVENIFEELDAPGEWFHDRKEGVLYFYPPAGIVMSEAVVEVARLAHLIVFQGSSATPVAFIALQGLTLRHAARTFMETKEPLLRSDWTIYRGGAVMLTGTENVSILDTEFDQPGGNAIFVNNYNRRVLIKGCHIHDAGASGVCFVGDPAAVRDPLFEYGQRHDFAKIDRTPGPQTENYPADSVVEDCLIHGIGRVERQPAGVEIAMARRITVRDTSIYDCARAGINIGDGTWGGHLIERCDVFDTVLETHDHGSFNSWGRDRFWNRDHLESSQAAVDADPGLPFLDAVETTVIRDSRWRCDHGWDIDLDDGSSNYDIYNNLMLRGGLKFREGFRRRAWNNITVNNGFHPHVWFKHSQDEVHTNIFMRSHAEIRVAGGGKRVDGNLFYSTNAAAKDAFPQFNWDAHSVVADPLFVDPAKGDFRVQDGSPALKLGFENFPMDRFGVKKPALKAIARTPIIPVVDPKEPARRARRPEAPAVWLGASLHALQGEEFSAFGVRKEEGGVALVEVPAQSPAALAGFKSGDLILAINGRQVRKVEDLRSAAEPAGEVRFVRDQQSQTIVLPSNPPSGQKASETDSATPITVAEPKVLGRGRGTFRIGPVLHVPRLNGASDWQLQVQQTDAATRERIGFGSNLLDLYMPDRGCTAWFKQPLEGPVTIVYRVLCPLESLRDPGIQARDINNFWHASDPTSAAGVFDPVRYNGRFANYNSMQGYYASTGGGDSQGNQTTRFRRFPRTVEGKDVPHIALTSRDGQPDYLITPGKWHTVQLVAWQGLVQYIVDGALVYEIFPGDEISVGTPDGGTKEAERRPYRLDEFPAYTSGYFGLRLVGTHHQYADLRIYRLLPADAVAP